MTKQPRPRRDDHVRRLPIWNVSFNGQATDMSVHAKTAVDALQFAVPVIVEEGGEGLSEVAHLAVGVTRQRMLGVGPVQAVPVIE